MNNYFQFVKPLLSSKETFKEAGIIIIDSGADTYPYVTAILPQNWQAIRLPGLYETYIICDEQNRIRATSHEADLVFGSYNNECSTLCPYYSITVINHKDGHEDGDFEVLFCSPSAFMEDLKKDNILFSGGRVHKYPAYDTEKREYSSDNPAVKACIDFANKNYPNWQDPLAYWD